MRDKHAIFHASISEEAFAQQGPRRERALTGKFGNITTESIWLDRDLRGITMYCDHESIRGVSLHTLSKTQTVGGKNYATPIFFPIHGPEEVISEIEIRTRSLVSPLAIVVSLESESPIDS